MAYSRGGAAVVTQGVADRIAERRSMERRRRFVRVGAVAAGAAAVGVLVWVAFFSSVFALDARDVVVDGGGKYVETAQVEDVLATEDGVPLPRIDTVGVREQLVALRGVQDAEVQRSWPKGLRVVIVPRVPVAAVPTSPGYTLLDGDGVQVAEVDRAPKDLPRIALPLDEVSEDASPSSGTRTLNSALIVLNALPADLRAEVADVSAKTQDAVVMTLRDKTVVEWGGSDEVALKVRVLELLRAAKQSKGAKVYDVSAPRMPITR